MVTEMEDFCFDSDIKDIKKVKLEDDNRNNEEVPDEVKRDKCNQDGNEPQFSEQSDTESDTEDTHFAPLNGGEKNLRDQKYRCKFCSKCFVSESRLKTHLVVHSDKKPRHSSAKNVINLLN